jgi:hypothetical protein
VGRGLLEQGRTLAGLPDRGADADRDIGQAIETWESLRKAFPDTPLYREWQAVAYEARAQVRADMRRLGLAAEDLEASRLTLEKLVQDFPDFPGYRGHLGRTYGALGRLALAGGDRRRAADWLAKAVESLRLAVERAPENALDRRSLEEAEAVRQDA